MAPPPIPPEVLVAARRRAAERPRRRSGGYRLDHFLVALNYVFITSLISLAFLFTAAWVSDSAMRGYEMASQARPEAATICLKGSGTCSLLLHRRATFFQMSPGIMCLLVLLIGLLMLRQAYVSQSIFLRLGAAASVGGALANACSFWRWGGVPDFIAYGNLLVSPGDVLATIGILICCIGAVVDGPTPLRRRRA